MPSASPALGDRVRKVDRLVLDVEVAFLVDDLFGFGHGVGDRRYLMLTMRS